MYSYRASASPAVSTVVYYPNGKVGRWVWLFVFAAVLFGSLYLSVYLQRTVWVECDRAAGACDIVSKWPAPLGTSTRAVPLPSIKSTHVDVFHGRRGSISYGLSFVTSSGTVSMTSYSSRDSRTRDAQKRALDAFLSNAREPSVRVDIDQPAGGAWLMLLFSLVWLFVAWALTGFALVEVDRAARTLTVVNKHWPLRDRRRTFPLESVRDAIVQRGRKATYSVALVVDTEPAPVPLVRMSSSGRGSKERAAQAIRDLLQQRDGGGTVEPM